VIVNPGLMFDPKGMAYRMCPPPVDVSLPGQRPARQVTEGKRPKGHGDKRKKARKAQRKARRKP
jgi:hypothetical protein